MANTKSSEISYRWKTTILVTEVVEVEVTVAGEGLKAVEEEAIRKLRTKKGSAVADNFTYELIAAQKVK